MRPNLIRKDATIVLGRGRPRRRGRVGPRGARRLRRGRWRRAGRHALRPDPMVLGPNALLCRPTARWCQEVPHSPVQLARLGRRPQLRCGAHDGDGRAPPLDLGARLARRPPRVWPRASPSAPRRGKRRAPGVPALFGRNYGRCKFKLLGRTREAPIPFKSPWTRHCYLAGCNGHASENISNFSGLILLESAQFVILSPVVARRFKFGFNY